MLCAARDAEKFRPGWAEIYNHEGMSEGGALWGKGMARGNVQKKEYAYGIEIGQRSLSRILIEEDWKMVYDVLVKDFESRLTLNFIFLCL